MTIAHGHRQAIQKLESFILATVKIADDECPFWGVHICREVGLTALSTSFNRRRTKKFMQ